MAAELSAFQFHLPDRLIAQEPPRRRGDSRLLLVQAGQGVREEIPFRDIAQVLRPADLLVLNQSEVLPARLLTRREDTGGSVEILLVRPEGPGRWSAMARPGRRLRTGVRLKVQSPWQALEAEEGGATLEVIEKREDGMVLVSSEEDPGVVARRQGIMPLPPYIAQELKGKQARTQDARDRERYQTVYAAADPAGGGSVAAPTAGLHFSEETLDRLQQLGVRLARLTLHVGPGTFQPPGEQQLLSRRLHREFFHLDSSVDRALKETRDVGGRVIAVGTTSLRVLETVARLGLENLSEDCAVFDPAPEDIDPVFEGRACRREKGWEVTGSTRLFIAPPDRVTAADGLLTNFHLPGSSLLMLVASLMGQNTWRTVYQHAVAQQMRFYSYGDCMLILPEAR